jgi:outer membrane protein assembly factor BamD (BamD/ComL family)
VASTQEDSEPVVLVLEEKTMQNPIFEKAIGNLAAGRYAEALKNYEMLAEASPNSEVVRITIKIIKERLSKECDLNPSIGSPNSLCPEFAP